MNEKGNILTILLTIILLAGLIVGVYLVTSNKLQIFNSRAGNEPITPVGPNITKSVNGTWQTTDPTVEFELTPLIAPPAP